MAEKIKKYDERLVYKLIEKIRAYDEKVTVKSEFNTSMDREDRKNLRIQIVEIQGVCGD